MDVESLLRHRAERDAFLAGHYASPLPDEHREGFAGLDYFPPDPAWVIAGTYRPAQPHAVAVRSSAGTESGYTMVGSVTLPIGGTDHHWIVLDDGDGGRFIPFRDGTSGDTTYAGGRYVGIEVATDGSATVDFNLAANPWCVYDEEFACPLPPPANVTSQPITAGEMMWHPGG